MNVALAYYIKIENCGPPTQMCHMVRIVRIQYGCWPFLR